MQYWIDGYNLILRQAWNQSGTLEAARDRLLRSVVRLGVPVRVFFDASGGQGLPETQQTPDSRVSLCFVRNGIADDAMIEALRRCNAKEITLVTDDRELKARARQQGANVVGVERFLTKLRKLDAPSAPKRKTPKGPKVDGEGRPRHVSEKEVDDWLQLFGFDDDDLEDPLLR